MGELLGYLDDQILIFLQTFIPLLNPFFGAITLLSDKLIIIGIMLVIFFCIDKKLAIRLTILLSITAFITFALKGIFGLKRPYLVNENEISGIPDLLGQIPDNYSFPSGHSSNAGTFWTFLAIQLRKSSFWVITIFMIVLIALSRCYLGVHWPTDVIVGVLLGIIVSVLFTYFLPKMEEYINKVSTPVILAIVIIIPILGLIFSYILTTGAGNPVELGDPSSWAGVLTGVTVGYLMEQKYINLKVKEFRSNRKVLTYHAILSFIIVAILYFGTKVVLEAFFKGFPLAQIARFSRYMIVAIIEIFGIPYLFTVIEKKFSLEPNDSI